MKFYLNALDEYQKKLAKKSNDFKRFRFSDDRVIINASLFSYFASPGIYFAQSRKDFRKALVSAYPFVYFEKKGRLFYNENGTKKKLGEGGIIALFPRKLGLTNASFKIKNVGSSKSTPGRSLTPTSEPTPEPTPAPAPEPPTIESVFPRGPRPGEISLETISGAISVSQEVDRFPISASMGEVVKLTVNGDGNTSPVVQLLDGQGRMLASWIIISDNSVSTVGYKVTENNLFAEVYAKDSFTGSYELQVERYESDAPLHSIPQDLLILLDQDAMDSADQYASRYLFSDEGLIYVSFGSGLTDELKRWWEDVLAATDALIEPEFVIVPPDHQKSQLVLNQAFESSPKRYAGIHERASNYWHMTTDRTNYNFSRNTQQNITIYEKAYTHFERFAYSREAGWKSTAFHELGHALGLEHPHDSADGDVDDIVDSNATIMSYVKVKDEDGDPGFTALDTKALQFIYGSETGDSTPSPLPGIPLLIESRTFDLSKRWKFPDLSASWIDGNTVQKPSTGLTSKFLEVKRTNGVLPIESRIYLDFEFGPDLFHWDRFTGYSEDFHDVIIAGEWVTFKPGETTALFEVPIVAGSQSESGDWLDVSLVPATPYHYSDIVHDEIRLSIVDT